MKQSILPALLFLLVISNGIKAQSTYEQVHALFQTNCTPACHSGASPSGNLNLSGSTADVYSRLVNVSPTNPAASAKGYKRIDPGYPHRSFLLKKINHGLDMQMDLAIDEGNPMPNYATALANEEIELIRQWIIWGAKDTGITYNSHLIHDYYHGMGLPDLAAPLTPEQEGREGYQVKFGPVFVEPHGEFEFFQVYDPKTTVDKEVYSMKSTMSPSSHHWVLRTVDAAGAAGFGSAPKDGTDINSQIFVFSNTEMWGVWQFSGDIDLPPGTAIFQDSAESLLLNLHIPNYSTTQILAATTYANVYTRDKTPNTIEMKAGLASYGDFNPFLLIVPNDGVPHVLQNHFTIPGETRYFWTIQAHSHSLGTDYDMFLRNSDGTKGNQIYEGFFNQDYTFNQGFYDYAHPAVKRFDPMLEVDMNNGLLFEATWLNNGPDTVGFGLTTREEMFVTYFQYTHALPTALHETGKDEFSLLVSPNPAKDNVNISYTLQTSGTALIELYNPMGMKVKSVSAGVQAEGKQQIQIDLSKEALPSGVYYVTLSVDGALSTKRIITMN